MDFLAEFLQTVLVNYSILQELWEKSVKLAKESEMTARNVAIACQMATFDFYFGVCIGEMTLQKGHFSSRKPIFCISC